MSSDAPQNHPPDSANQEPGGSFDDAIDQQDKGFSVQEKTYSIAELDAIEKRAEARIEAIINRLIAELKKPKPEPHFRFKQVLFVISVASLLFVGIPLALNKEKNDSADIRKDGIALVTAAATAVFGYFAAPK